MTAITYPTFTEVEVLIDKTLDHTTKHQFELSTIIEENSAQYSLLAGSLGDRLI
jgi:hypothetical protein